MGNAHGGDWKPRKEDDKRFLGEPGEINYTHYEGKKGGYDRATKIGKDGKTIKERHFTDHDKPWAHSNPHDHFINWNNEHGVPIPSSPINYPDEVPEFKNFEEIKNMNDNTKTTHTVIHIDPEDYRFKTISDFKFAMKYRSEVTFEWKGKDYSITHPNGVISICESHKPETEKYYDSPEETLEYVIDGQRLREIITKVTVWDRTI